MTTVFIGESRDIGGSRNVSRFNAMIWEGLQTILDAGLGVFLGDANGADKAAQRWFAERGYRQITIFHSGTSPRDNLRNWETRTIIPKSRKKDFFYHTAKDLAMAEEADYGFMLWDGVSKGTLNNMLNLQGRGKKSRRLFQPCQRLRNPPPDRRCDLAVRTAQPEAKLQSGLIHMRTIHVICDPPSPNVRHRRSCQL